MDVERPRAGRHAAPIREEPLERLDERGAAPAVVLDQLLDRLPVAVVRRVVELEMHQVLVRAEPLV
jgi:hypothetical protein